MQERHKFKSKEDRLYASLQFDLFMGAPIARSLKTDCTQPGYSFY